VDTINPQIKVCQSLALNDLAQFLIKEICELFLGIGCKGTRE